MKNYIADYGVAFVVVMDIYQTANPEAFASAFTPAAGDVKISTDDGATFSSTTNTASFSNGIIRVTLTATEMQTDRMIVKFEDQDASAVTDTAVEILTKNHASSFFGNVDIAVDSNGYVRLQGVTHASAVIPNVSTVDTVTNVTNDPHAHLITTIATLASQVSFTLTAGSADNDAYNDWSAVIIDASTSTQKAGAIVSDYVGATKTITLAYDPAVFTMAVGDTIILYPPVAADTRRINGAKVVGDGNATPWDGA